MKVVVFFTLIFINHFTLFAQADSIHWHFTLSNADPKLNEDNQLIISINLPEDWGMYASNFQSGTFGPTPTLILFNEPVEYFALDAIRSINPTQAEEPSFDLKYAYFASQAEFRQCIRLIKNQTNIKGIIKGQLFHLKNGKTSPFEKAFDLTINIDSNN